MAQASSKESTTDVAEQISALVDGFGEESELSAATDEACSDSGRLWDEYQLIGDVLRSPDLVENGVDSAAFMLRMKAALEHEPHLLSPQVARRTQARASLLQARRAIPAVAGLAAVAMVGWVVALQLGLGEGEAFSLAKSRNPVVTEQHEGQQVAASQFAVAPRSQRMHREGDAAGGMIRDPQLDEYLQAHTQYALQTGMSRLYSVSAPASEGCAASC